MGASPSKAGQSYSVSYKPPKLQSDLAGAGNVPESTDFSPPKPYARRGGASFHKPNCPCPACRRRNGQAKAVPRGTGVPGVVVPPEGTEILMAEPEERPTLKPIAASGNTARDRVAQWIYYRAVEPGITTAEIARRLGIAPQSLYKVLNRARAEGWLQIEDPLTRIEVEILPKIVRNIDEMLEDRSEKVTIEAMKGFLVPIWKDSQGIEENKVQVLGLKIEMPEGGITAKGVITGTPRRVGGPREIEPVTLDATFTSSAPEE